MKPCILVAVLDDAFGDVLRPYLVTSLAGDEDLKLDRVIELLESSYIEKDRREQLDQLGNHREGNNTGDTALATRDRNKGDKCHHCHMKGHWQAGCRIYKEKVKKGWKNPPPCRTRRDFHDDDRDPTHTRHTKS